MFREREISLGHGSSAEKKPWTTKEKEEEFKYSTGAFRERDVN
jgi:hypothetical protein